MDIFDPQSRRQHEAPSIPELPWLRPRPPPPSRGLAFAAYPERPITLIAPWGAGGGTDAAARIIAAELEQELKQPINVVNRTGGSGVVGHQAIASAQPDGYTIGILTVEIGMMRHAGLDQLSSEDYTPLALMNFDANAVMVRADSPIKTAQDLLAAAKANPGKLKASGTGQGGIWHLGLAQWLRRQQAARQRDRLGAQPGRRARPARPDGRRRRRGVVLAAARRALIEAGKVNGAGADGRQARRHLPQGAALQGRPIGIDWNIGAWRGIAAPKGLPKDMTDKLAAALKKIYDGKGYQDFLAAARLRRALCGPRRLRQVHGREGRRVSPRR